MDGLDEPDIAANTTRGISLTATRDVRCKDCLREVAAGLLSEDEIRFEYSESWAIRLIERGGSRTDRCARHRKSHRRTINGIAVAYVDLQTIGEVADRLHPTGPLGALGELPRGHQLKSTPVDLAPFAFGMTDRHILEILELLRDKRILVLKAGTGTGKSTFFPFRLMNPPLEAAMRLTDNGPIVVTEPRVQATTGVARFVGERLVMGCHLRTCALHGQICEVDSCAQHAGGVGHGPISPECVISDCSAHVGPGFPVGYQVSGDKNHDDGCNLIYVTDGTVINWLKEGRLSKIGTVIVDEAHERSTNIDFILGTLRKEITRFPHLRVIITSATFSVPFYVDYFGGDDAVATLEVPAVKDFGYGEPLFPGEAIEDIDQWLLQYWPVREGPELDPSGVREDLWDTTRRLHRLRFKREIPRASWRHEMTGALAEFTVSLVQSLDREGIPGDILAFLPTRATIMDAVDAIRGGLSEDEADVFALLATSELAEKESALASRPYGAKRKVVVSTNLAETSLTVRGVRFVIDSGLIAQSEWDPTVASGGVPTKPHSRSGIQQRWGRVGRDSPGWVFPLYSRRDFEELAVDTPPESSRSNLEKLFLKAKESGIDDLSSFPWPAGHEARGLELDDSARRSIDLFTREVERANAALRISGAVDGDGHLTGFGRDLGRFLRGQRSAAFAMSVIYADQLACAPEVVTALALLEDAWLEGPSGLLSQLGAESPLERRVHLALCHRSFYEGCLDDLDLVLKIASTWEQVDPNTRPWEDSQLRRVWASQWGIEHTGLLAAAELRRETLALLSPAMKEEPKRRLDLGLVQRARAVISRAFSAYEYARNDESRYELTANRILGSVTLDRNTGLVRRGGLLPDRVIALNRRNLPSGRLRNLISPVPWAVEDDPTPLQLLVRCADSTSPTLLAATDAERLVALALMWPIGMRFTGVASDGADSSEPPANNFEAIPPFDWANQCAGDDIDQPVGPDADSPVVRSAADSDPLSKDIGPSGQLVGAGSSVVSLQMWPTGNPYPEEDEALVKRWAVLDPAEDPRDPSSGLESNDDESTRGLVVVGRPVDAVSASAPLGLTPLGHVPMAVEEWSQPLPDGPAPLVVTGYCADGPDIRLRVAADWLTSDLRDDPTTHPDLEIGQQVEVVVGPELSAGSTKARSFLRRDGRGRFLLEEYHFWSERGPRPLPNSLDANYHGLLERLVAGEAMSLLVVPAVSGGKTISLIPSLAAHIDRANTESRVRIGSARAKERRFWPAEVVQRPSGGGWLAVELLHRDSSRGVFHRFGVDPRLTKSIGRLPVGASVLVQLGYGAGHLRMPLELLRALPANWREEVSAPNRTSGADDRSAIKSIRGVSRALLNFLLQFDSSAEWQQEVWNFFVWSNRRTVEAVMPGSPGPKVEVAFDDLGALNALRNQFPIGASVLAEVVRVDKEALLVSVAPSVDVLIPAHDVPGEGADLHERFRLWDAIEATISSFELDDDKRPQIALSMRSLGTSTGRPWTLERLAARFPAGSVESGPVVVTYKSATLVKLDVGVRGLLPAAKIEAKARVAKPFQTGQVLDVEVVRVGVGEDGRPQVEVALRRLSGDEGGGIDPPSSPRRHRSEPATVWADVDDVREAILAAVRGVVEGSQTPVALVELAQLVRRDVGPQVLESRWAGAGSFKALLRSADNLGYSVDSEGPGHIYDPARHDPGPVTVWADVGDVREAILAAIRHVVQRSETPVALGRLAQLVRREIGPQVSQSEWAGAGSLKALLHSEDNLGYTVTDGPGQIYDPSRHDPPT